MKEVKKEAFENALQKQNLKPISSFSDSGGTSPFGYGEPAMDTDYGKKGSQDIFARCEMRKEYEEEKWQYTYYIKSPNGRKKRSMTKVTQEIDSYIKKNGGCERDALNVALFTIEKLKIEIELLNQAQTGEKNNL